MEFANQEEAEQEVKRLRKAMRIASLLITFATRTPQATVAVQQVMVVQEILDDAIDPTTATPLP